MPSNYAIQILIEAKDKNTSKVSKDVRGEIKAIGDVAEEQGNRIQHALAGAAIAMAFGQALPLMRRAIADFNSLRSGLVGLRSVVKHVGEDWGEAEAKLRSYVADGLIPFSQATTALKNLLLRGYGLERSIELLYRLKDAAAYGRQGQLSLGRAVVSASEGLKNMISALVDNAGVTKNVGDMWKEYAKSIGVGVGALSDAQRVEAEYLGIIKETLPQLGNAKKITFELAGAEAGLDAKKRILSETIGKSLAPAYADLLEKMSPVLSEVTKFVEANPKATATLLGGSGLVAAIAGLAVAFALMGPGGALVVGVAAAIVGLAAGVAKLSSVLKPSTAALEGQANAAGDQAEKMRELKKTYVELEGKPEKSEEEHRDLKNVMDEIAAIVPLAVEAWNDESEALRLNTIAIDEYIVAQEILRQHNMDKLDEKRNRLLTEQAEIRDRLRLATSTYMAMEASGIGILREFDAELESQAWGMKEDAKATDRAGKSLADFLTEIQIENNLLEDNVDALKEVDTALGRLRKSEEDTEDTTNNLNTALSDTAAAQMPLEDFFSWYVEKLAAIREIQREVMDELGKPIETDMKAGKELDKLTVGVSRLQTKLGELGKSWTDWESQAVGVVSRVGNLFADTVGAIASGNQDAMEQMMEQWKGFFGWLVAEVTRIMVRWLIGKVLLAFGLPGFGGGGMLGGQGSGVIGSTYARDAGVITGGIEGLDSVIFRGMPGELVTSVPLTHGLERFISDWESRRNRPPEPAYAMPSGRGELPPVTVTTPDVEGFRRQIRNGSLGREWLLAQRRGRLPRY